MSLGSSAPARRSGLAQRAGVVQVVQDGGQAHGMSTQTAGWTAPGRWPIRRFGDLIRATPSLRAYQADMMDQFARVATQILAARAGMSTGDPEPQIAARALLGLWHVQADSLRHHLHGSPAAAQVRRLVTADVRRAARLIDTGLRSFAR